MTSSDPVARLKEVQAQLQGMGVPGFENAAKAAQALTQPGMTDQQVAVQVLLAYEGFITTTRTLLQQQLAMVEQVLARNDEDAATVASLMTLKGSFEDQLLGLDELQAFLQEGNPEKLRLARRHMQKGADAARKLKRKS